MTKRILVVDDEIEFSELLQFRLRSLNCEVLAAATGTEALNTARSELPDVILLDLLLPDFDGLTLCEILRRRSPTREIPIILITAVTSEATQQAAKIAGVDSIPTRNLSLPFTEGGLRVRLQRDCAKLSARVHYPEVALCTDNGAMIALAGAFRLAQARPGAYGFSVEPRWDLASLDAPGGKGVRFDCRQAALRVPAAQSNLTP